MPHSLYYHRPTFIKELIVLAVFNLIMFILFLSTDTLEIVYEFSRKHEYFELDEVIPLGFTLGVSMLVFSYRRIKELGRMAQTLERLSLVDPLTNLPNRRAGQIKLISWCEHAEQTQKSFHIFQLDLDNFKSVNELYGQLVGDEIIQLVGQKLTSRLPQGALLYRWLDDNFIIVCPTSITLMPYEIAEKLQQVINGEIMPSTLTITCSIGFTSWQSKQSAEDLLQSAEDALLSAKSAGKSCIKIA
jgi:diguanylate cyclase (GGDEF)-like protein